jgi:uncharacterized membrane protein YjjP (DUF1212 family)
MKTVFALLVKLALTLAAAAISGYFVGVVNWGLFFLIALVGSISNYIIGDLMILPAAGNVIASIADGGIAAMIAYIIVARNPSFAVNESVMYVMIFGMIITGSEYFFHRWLLSDNKISPDPKR